MDIQNMAMLEHHLTYNVFPPLNRHVIRKIEELIDSFNTGKIDTTTQMQCGNRSLTFGEIVDDMKLDFFLEQDVCELK